MLLILLPAATAAPLPLGVEGIVFSTDIASGAATGGELVRRVEGVFATNDIKVSHRPGSYFEDDAPAGDLRLGLHVVDTDCRPVAEDTIRCRSRVEWELYHRPSDSVVYRTSIVGSASSEAFDEAIAKSILESANLVRVRPAFLARLEEGFYPPEPARVGVRPCEETDAAVVIAAAEAALLPVDDDGQVLAVGATPDPLLVQIAGGPALEATRLAQVDGLGLYDLPVKEGLGCVADAAALPSPVGAARTVGDALAALGSPRLKLPAPPVALFDKGAVSPRARADVDWEEEEDDDEVAEGTSPSRTAENVGAAAEAAAEAEENRAAEDEERRKRKLMQTMGWTSAASLSLMLLLLVLL